MSDSLNPSQTTSGSRGTLQGRCATIAVAVLSTLATASICTAAQVEIDLRAYVDSIQMKPGALTTVWRYTGTLDPPLIGNDGGLLAAPVSKN